MYLKHWKLARRPFDERVDPRWYFSTSSHQETVFQLRSAVAQRSTLVVLAGGFGYGKSMVAAVLGEALAGDNHRLAYSSIAADTAAEALERMAEELSRPETQAPGSRPRQKQEESGIELLRILFATGEPDVPQPVVFCDGADYLAECELRDLARLLAGAAADGSGALTAILSGSGELWVRARPLLGPNDPPLHRCLLGAMTGSETAGYIRHHLALAAGSHAIFSDPALELIHDLSGGVPRRVNRLCGLSLVVGYTERCSQVTESQVWTAQAEMRVLAPTRTATAPARRRWKPLVHPQAHAQT